MKTIYKTSFVILFAAVALMSCSKKSDVKPATTTTTLAGTWQTTQWGGVNGDILQFTIDKSATTATVTAITGNGYGFTSGDVIYSNIKANSDGTYSCSGSYSPDGSSTSLLTRSATMSLQNNNTQLTVYYPALNSSFPAITYVYTSGGITIEAE